MRTFPILRDLVTDVSYNYEVAKRIPPFSPRAKTADEEEAGGYRMQQIDVERSQEFRKCIECFLCQDVCHVIRDHEENKTAFAGPRFFARSAELEMHPLDVNDRRELLQQEQGLGKCNITKCCTEVCPEHIKITDNAIIPLKERVVDASYDPVAWLGRKILKPDQAVAGRGGRRVAGHRAGRGAAPAGSHGIPAEPTALGRRPTADAGRGGRPTGRPTPDDGVGRRPAAGPRRATGVARFLSPSGSRSSTPPWQGVVLPGPGPDAGLGAVDGPVHRGPGGPRRARRGRPPGPAGRRRVTLHLDLAPTGGATERGTGRPTPSPTSPSPCPTRTRRRMSKGELAPAEALNAGPDPGAGRPLGAGGRPGDARRGQAGAR